MPGSPPTSVTKPGTTPPPSTRSSSGTPVERVAQPATSPPEIGTAGLSAADGLAGADVSRRSSSKVLHALQDGQRPDHCTALTPHSVHRNDVRSFPMPPSWRPPVTLPRIPARAPHAHLPPPICPLWALSRAPHGSGS